MALVEGLVFAINSMQQIELVLERNLEREAQIRQLFLGSPKTCSRTARPGFALRRDEVTHDRRQAGSMRQRPE